MIWALTPPDWDREQREFETKQAAELAANREARQAESDRKKAEFAATMNLVSEHFEQQRRTVVDNTVRDFTREQLGREPTEDEVNQMKAAYQNYLDRNGQ
jgi:hypothetical protein